MSDHPASRPGDSLFPVLFEVTVFILYVNEATVKKAHSLYILLTSFSLQLCCLRLSVISVLTVLHETRENTRYSMRLKPDYRGQTENNQETPL